MMAHVYILPRRRQLTQAQMMDAAGPQRARVESITRDWGLF